MDKRYRYIVNTDTGRIWNEVCDTHDPHELGYFNVIQRYEPWWPSFPSLKRHLVKNNTSIELAEEPQEQRA